MRTITLFAMTGLIAAAQTPKPAPATHSPARLNTAEITAFAAVEGRMQELRKAYEELNKQRDAIKADTCQRTLGVPACEIKPDGTTAPLPAKEK